jgi:hypothetical protein
MSFDSQRLRTCTYSRQQAVREIRRGLAKLDCDHEADKRRQERECLYCFYLHRARMAGQAFTGWECLSCGAGGMHSNTAVPHYCDVCADKMRICVRCGADQELEDRKLTTVWKGMGKKRC